MDKMLCRDHRRDLRAHSAVLLLVMSFATHSAQACIVAPSSEAMAPSVAAAQLVAHGVASGERLDDRSNALWILVDIDKVSRGLTPFRVEAVSPCGVVLPEGTRVVVLGSGPHLTVFSAWTLRDAGVPGLAPAR